MANTCFPIKVKYYSRIIEGNPKKNYLKDQNNKGGRLRVYL